MEDAIHAAVGVAIQHGLGDAIHVGDVLAIVHYYDVARLGEAMILLQNAWKIDDAPPTVGPIILDTITH